MSATPIPAKYLKHMGSCSNLNVHGETVIHVFFDSADSSAVTEQHISDFKSHLSLNNVKAVGVDVKKKLDGSVTSVSSKKNMIVLSASNRCLILHVPYSSCNNGKNIPNAVYDIFKDLNNYICFVGPPALLEKCNETFLRIDGYCNVSIKWNSLVVSAGELAARVLKKPGLTTSTLADIAREVGVQYNGPATGTGFEIEVDSSNPMVLTEDMTKKTINDAVAHYLIASKLLSSIRVD